MFAVDAASVPTVIRFLCRLIGRELDDSALDVPPAVCPKPRPAPSAENRDGGCVPPRRRRRRRARTATRSPRNRSTPLRR
ncbi:hypothetical protein [Melissospora conviva]|uniref:hypothetical protein n=1 Tax=Melissospora conviva TaxID=3388432 RepID=UPI003B768D99